MYCREGLSIQQVASEADKPPTNVSMYQPLRPEQSESELSDAFPASWWDLGIERKCWDFFHQCYWLK